MANKNEFRYDPNPNLGKIDNVSIPSAESLNYAKDSEILRFKGLTLHVLTTIVVTDILAGEIDRANSSKKKEEQLDVNRDLMFETNIAYHAPRGMAEDGVSGRSTAAINSYMLQHDDIELATLLGSLEHLPLSVIQQMEHFQSRRGFPNKTIGPDNLYRPEAIDWNGALEMIASWSVAGTILPIDRRFEDLIHRHANVPNSPKKLTYEDLLRYKEWGKARIDDLSRHIGVTPENFTNFLKGKLFEGVPDAQQKSDELIRELFKREPLEDEFLPVSPAYKYLATSIMGIDNVQRRRVVNSMLKRPEEFIRRVRRFGLIVGEDTNSLKTLQ